MSWFAELVIAEAFAEPTPDGREGAIFALHPLSAPFCHNLAHPPLRFGPGGEGERGLRRLDGAIWPEAPMPVASVNAAGRALVAGRAVLADLRGIEPETHAALLAEIALQAGAAPFMVRQSPGGAAPSGYAVLWETGERDDVLWISVAARGGTTGARLARFIERHRSGAADAFDTALAHAARPGPVTGLRFRADGGVALGLDPIWCLREFDGLRAARTMLTGELAIGAGDPARLSVPPVGPGLTAVEIALHGPHLAVTACRAWLDGAPAAAAAEWRRGVGRLRLDLAGAACLAHEIVLDGHGVAVTGLDLLLPPPLDGLYGPEFADPLDRYDLPGGPEP